MIQRITTTCLAIGVLAALIPAQQAPPAPKKPAERDSSPPASEKTDAGGKSRTNPGQPSGFVGWVCAILGFDPAAYAGMGAVKGGDTQLEGNRITQADVSSQEESRIADCESCWSLARLDGDRLAVLKSDGIWAANLKTGAFGRLFEGVGLRQIVGRVAGRKEALLVVGDDGAGCKLRIEIIDLAVGRREPEPPPYGCVNEPDLAALRRPDASRVGRYLSTTEPGPFPSSLLVSESAKDGRRPLLKRQLLPLIEERQDGIDRFDPVWLTDTTVAYLQRGGLNR